MPVPAGPVVRALRADAGQHAHVGQPAAHRPPALFRAHPAYASERLAQRHEFLHRGQRRLRLAGPGGVAGLEYLTCPVGRHSFRSDRWDESVPVVAAAEPGPDLLLHGHRTGYALRALHGRREGRRGRRGVLADPALKRQGVRRHTRFAGGRRHDLRSLLRGDVGRACNGHMSRFHIGSSCSFVRPSVRPAPYVLLGEKI
mmetsp:Transcript_7403/g.15341  ORF Transcript_7403/g.15341 Transcript_7403/m.15341 type:complete len:200 (-) Transcript_7403:23-622(-)